METYRMQNLKVWVREDVEEEEEVQVMIKEDWGETEWCESWKARENLNRNKNNDAKYSKEVEAATPFEYFKNIFRQWNTMLL